MNSLGTVFNFPEQFKNCSLIKNKISQGTAADDILILFTFQ